MGDAIERLRAVQGYERSRSIVFHLVGDFSIDPRVLVVAGEVGPEPGLLRRYDGLLFTVSDDL